MRELGVQESQVRVMKTQTDKVPTTSATAASSGSDLNGAAVKAACDTLRERLAPIAAEHAERRFCHAVPRECSDLRLGLCARPAGAGVTVAFERIAERAYLKQVPLSATGFYRTPGIGYDKSKGRGETILLLRLWRCGERSRSRWLYGNEARSRGGHPA